MIHLQLTGYGIACGENQGLWAMLRTFVASKDKCPKCEAIRQAKRIQEIPLDVAPPFPGKSTPKRF